MRILVTRDPENEIAKAFAAFANPIRRVSLSLALACLSPSEASVILCVTDLSGLPPDALDAFRAHPLCRIILGSSATIDHGGEFVRWLHAGATDILLPGIAEERLRERFRWAVDGVAEPGPGCLVPAPPLGDVYLLTPYRRQHLDTMERWVKPALQYAGYQGVLIKDIHSRSIRDAENHMAQACTFAVVHMGRDERVEAIHNPRIHGELRTLINKHKLVIGIRHSSEADFELPGDLREINCHHFDSDHDLARWLYKLLVKARINASGGTTHH